MNPDDSDKKGGWVKSQSKAGATQFEAGGDWSVAHVSRLSQDLEALSLPDTGTVDINASSIEKLDSAGAWLLIRTKRSLEKEGRKIGKFDVPERYAALIKSLDTDHKAPPVEIENENGFRARLERIGHTTIDAGKQGYRILGFLGRVTVETIEAFAKPRGNLRVAALVHQVEETGINALPIVGLLLFLIGVVLAYQGADQLEKVASGAQRFTVNLVGVSVLRELGVLITAIIIAGRSGSAFTAQIGTMKVNEEIDAMRTLGLNTVDVLVLPRVLGLVISLPLLTLYADIMAMIGGAMMCYFELGMTIPVFLRELRQAVSLNSFWVGIVKAPVFAIVIALVGCFEGLRVERNAESVGKQTTRSVVESIFLVIVLDAGFSVMFSVLGI